MLKHESVTVRCLGLERLLQVICDNKKQMYHALSRQDASTHDTNNFVVAMLKDLLLLAVKETNSKVLSACAECLGELGAIDPARIKLVLPTVMKKRAPKAIHTGLGRQSGSRKAEMVPLQLQSETLHAFNMAPWELSPTEMSLILLETHLVPSLKVRRIW